MSEFPDYMERRRVKDRSAWMQLFEANRSYYTELVPTLQLSLETIVIPKPLLELVARFVRGPFQL
jgi:hypothetical protein